MTNILVTGAGGQIGSDLAAALRDERPGARVLCTDLADDAPGALPDDLPYEPLDVRDEDRLRALMRERKIGVVYHLASLLSAVGEGAPDRTWNVNLGGLKNVLDTARDAEARVFWPSSIAVFGPGTPRENVPQQTVLDPQTMYGVTKVSGEMLCRYYHQRYDVDARSLRYPGLISYTAPPGGGTTDYAPRMIAAAARGEAYTCFVRPDTRLPMMYMPDAIRAALALMDAEAEALSVRTSYNVGALSFSAQELADALTERRSDFRCRFEPDERQQIADSWPASLDDEAARRDWNWQPRYDLDALTDDMLEKLPVAS
jgi:nucleoside-diphosphate-sugar epimerase